MNRAAVGAFVLLLGAALIAGVLWLAAGGSSHGPVDLYLAIEDESVSGLSVNAPVKYHGVEVGTVRAITLDTANPERVRLLLALGRGTPVKVDTEAMLKTQGLTGIAYVELSGGTPASPLLRPGAGGALPEIRTIPSLGTRLENVLAAVLLKLDNTTTRVDAMLGPQNQQALASTLADLAAVSRTLAARRDSIDTALRGAARTVAHAERVAAAAGPAIDGVGRAAAALEATGRAAERSSLQAGATVEAIGRTVQRAGDGTLPELQRLLEETQALSASLRRLVEQTERQPSSLLLGRGAAVEGPGEAAVRP